LLIRRVRSRSLNWVLPAVIVGVPIMRTIIFFEYKHGAYADGALMPCRADTLLLGVLCAVLYRNNRGWEFVKKHTSLLWWLLGLLILGILRLTGASASDTTSLLLSSVGYTWLALFYSCILLLTLSSPENILSKLANFRGFRWLGSIAYGVYLLHVTLLELCLILLRGQSHGIRNPGDLACVVLAIALTLGICAVSWKYFEKPLLKRGHAFKY
jgi:peptidoglycan/LPS O-acetylase OafA/YrhL